nr:ileal sodium/bile acid cotransporter-like [Lytechinus pictus]
MVKEKPRNIIKSMANNRLTIAVFILMAVASTKTSAKTDATEVNVTFGDFPALYSFEKTERTVNLTILAYEGKSTVTLQFDTTNPRVFQIVNQSSTYIELSPNGDYPTSFTFYIRGIALGIEDLLVVMGKNGSRSVVHSMPVKINLQPKAILIVVKYVMLFCVIVGFVNMGGTIDLKLIWQKLRRPWGVLIGILCQFLIMPPLAFGLAKVLKLDPPSAVGLVLDGSCPGGHLSNIISVMLDVDYVLSLTMTFCSNILAMGMMPLNLFIYTPPFTEGNAQLETPFVEIGIQLILLFIPISIGMFIKYKSPRINRICEKLLKPLSAFILALMLATSLPFQLFIFDAPRETYIAAFLLPLCGGVIGLSISKMACLPVKSMVTIALETGVQNAILATTIIAFFYPHPESEIASRAPYLILLMTIFEGIILVVVYTFVKTFIWKPREDEEAIVDDKGVDPDVDGDVIKNGTAVTGMTKKYYLNEVNANDIDVEAKKTEMTQGCQTDFDEFCYTNSDFSL